MKIRFSKSENLGSKKGSQNPGLGPPFCGGNGSGRGVGRLGVLSAVQVPGRGGWEGGLLVLRYGFWVFWVVFVGGACFLPFFCWFGGKSWVFFVVTTLFWLFLGGGLCCCQGIYGNYGWSSVYRLDWMLAIIGMFFQDGPWMSEGLTWP